jgi:hypothetical protein
VRAHRLTATFQAGHASSILVTRSTGKAKSEGIFVLPSCVPRRGNTARAITWPLVLKLTGGPLSSSFSAVFWPRGTPSHYGSPDLRHGIFAPHPGTARQQLDGAVTDDHAVAVDEILAWNRSSSTWPNLARGVRKRLLSAAAGSPLALMALPRRFGGNPARRSDLASGVSSGDRVARAGVRRASLGASGLGSRAPELIATRRANARRAACLHRPLSRVEIAR